MRSRQLVTYPGFLWDAGERLFWTAAQLAGGAFLAWAASGDAWSWQTFAFAVALAAAKQVAARQIGGPTARALPGHKDELVRGNVPSVSVADSLGHMASSGASVGDS